MGHNDVTVKDIADNRTDHEGELTSRPFTKAEAQAQWSPDMVARVMNALVVPGD